MVESTSSGRGYHKEGKESGSTSDQTVSLLDCFTKSNADLTAKRHTFHDLPSVQHIPVHRADWMRIDVELCGQILMMRRREAHLEGVVKCLEVRTLVFIFGYRPLTGVAVSYDDPWPCFDCAS